MAGILTKKLFLQPQIGFTELVETSVNFDGYTVTLPAGKYKINLHGGGGASGEPGGNYSTSYYTGGWGGAGGTGNSGTVYLTLTAPHSFFYYVGAGGAASPNQTGIGVGAAGGAGGEAGNNQGPAGGRGGNGGEPTFIRSIGALPSGSTMLNQNNLPQSYGYMNLRTTTLGNIIAWVSGGGGGGGGGASGTIGRRYDNGGAGGGGGGTVYIQTDGDLDAIPDNLFVFLRGDAGRPSTSSGTAGRAGSSGGFPQYGTLSGASGAGAGAAGAAAGQGWGAGGASGGGGNKDDHNAGGCGGAGAPGNYGHGGQSMHSITSGAYYDSPSDATDYSVYPEQATKPDGTKLPYSTPAVYGQGGISADQTTSQRGGAGWIKISKI